MTPIHPDGLTLNDYVDDALPSTQRAVVEAHLTTCAACRELVEGLRSVAAAAPTLEPIEPPRRAWTRIEQEIRGRQAVRRVPRWSWLAAAAALVLATFGGLRLAHVWRQPTSSPQAALTPASDA